MEPLWKPSLSDINSSNLHRYRQYLKQKYNLAFGDYHELWQWSVDSTELFWTSIWDFFEVKSSSDYTSVTDGALMPKTKWFNNSKLNYVENIFKNKNNEFPAIISLSESRIAKETSWSELEKEVAAIQAVFRNCGIEKGDRIAAFVPNIVESSIALLATLSTGAIWSSCSPDFGVESVIDRFLQIQPKILIAANGYEYNGKKYSKTKEVVEIVKKISSIEVVIWIDFIQAPIPETNVKNLIWDDCLKEESKGLIFEQMDFNDPIWILYSSGTTGLPKAITHSHGGMLLEHLKYLSLQNDVRVGERFFWYSTTGWMMWNFVHASLLVGATAVIYDGSPAYPNLEFLWQLAEGQKINHFGTSAPFLVACMKENLDIKSKYNLENLKSIGSTGSPLPPEAFDFVYQNIKENLWLCSMSGGTDVCTAFVGSCIERAVYKSEIQCRALGVSLEVWNESREPVIQEMGEMVLTKPMPCMPIYFWNDIDFQRYNASYFELYPNVWRHGDWIEVSSHDGLIIYGRSDATLNRHGVRIGTAEIYNVVNQFKEIKDSLVVNLELKGGEHYMPIFIEMNADFLLDEILIRELKTQLKSQYSPRHVPDEFIAVEQIPYTISGKKMEGPVKKILLNMNLNKAYNKDAMRNPESMNFFIKMRDEKGFEI
jgi:acetoacetyl-CoA synthetase